MRLTGFFVLDLFGFRCYGLGMGKKRRQLSNYLYQASGLNVVSIEIAHYAFNLIPEFGNLVEVLILLQPVKRLVQSDISGCPYRVNDLCPNSVNGANKLYELLILGDDGIRCSGLVASLRQHIVDRGGQTWWIGASMLRFNQAHGELVRLGFSARVYHPWATRCGIEGYRPPPKNVIDSL